MQKHNNAPEKISGRITKVYFAGPDFSAGRILTIDKEEVQFAGNLCVKENQPVVLIGTWTSHPKYGRQFKVSAMEHNLELDQEGLIHYMANHPDIKGIGPVKAKRIVDKFGDAFEETLLERPEDIAKAGQLSKETVQLLRDEWIKNKSLNSVLAWLSAFGLTHHQVTTLVKNLGEDCLSILKADPYIMIHEIRGFGFKKVDLIARKLGTSKDHVPQLSFAAAEGLNSLLHNLAERTFDQAGSYLVNGFDSFIADIDTNEVEIVTNAGRAYIQGFRHQRDLPTSTAVPKSVATKSVRGEQKTFNINERRYPVNSTPLKETTQVEGIVEITANVTRGSVGGGEDLLTPNPVVDILEVSQGATIFTEGVDWQQAGNSVDWIGAGSEPAIGTTYTVRWTYAKQMIKGEDYVDGGWFGEVGHPNPSAYFYTVTAFDAAGETAFSTAKMVARNTSAGDMNKLTWLPVNGALGYRVYRSINGLRTNFQRIKELGSEAVSYIDDGVDEAVAVNPPANTSTTLSINGIQIEAGNLNIINLGRSSVGDQPVHGSNCSIDYDYYLGRRDIIYATTKEIKRLEGAPADFPKLPIVPEGTLGLCSIDCPPNSTEMSIWNFGLTRITMDRIHDIIKDVEDLKYNDAQYQMNNELQNRDAQTKKGIYSDDFSNDAQSDIYHAEWDARVNGLGKFVAPDRIAESTALVVDQASSITFS